MIKQSITLCCRLIAVQMSMNCAVGDTLGIWDHPCLHA